MRRRGVFCGDLAVSDFPLSVVHYLDIVAVNRVLCVLTYKVNDCPVCMRVTLDELEWGHTREMAMLGFDIA